MPRQPADERPGTINEGRVKQRGRYVEFGCGWAVADNTPDWRYFDASPTLIWQRIPLVGRIKVTNAGRFDRRIEYGDIVRGLPIDADSAEGVYCSHVLEASVAGGLSSCDPQHVPNAEARRPVPHGVARPRAPHAPLPRRRVARGRHRVPTRERTGTRDAPTLAPAVSSSGGSATPHTLWMWDFNTLAEALRRAGFVDGRRAWLGRLLRSRIRSGRGTGPMGALPRHRVPEALLGGTLDQSSLSGCSPSAASSQGGSDRKRQPDPPVSLPP